MREDGNLAFLLMGCDLQDDVGALCAEALLDAPCDVPFLSPLPVPWECYEDK